MTDTFHNIRLPDEVEVGTVGGPTFNTSVISISSGAEQRNSQWAQQRHVWQLSYGIQTQVDYAAVLDHFYGRRGRAYSFPFKDWSDPSAINEQIGVGDGINRVFHLKKTYGGAYPFVRYITRPDWSTVVVKLNGVVDTSWVSGAGGTVQWAVGYEPAAAAVITWSGDFFIPVRYDVDNFTLTLAAMAAGEVTMLNIIEVREDPNIPPVGVAFTNAVTTIGDNTSTASRVFVADIVVIDDGLGTNSLSLSGTDAAKFEIDSTTSKLYLKAGTVLNGPSTYHVNVDAEDIFIAGTPVSTAFTLNVTLFNRVAVISFTNVSPGLFLNADTTSHVHVADINLATHSSGTSVLSLTGADAAKFELVGSALYLVAGTDTSVAGTLHVTVVATDTAVSPGPDYSTKDFTLTIGVVAGEMLYDTAGSFTLTTPLYNTLEIEVDAAGCGSFGYSPGITTAPTPAGATYVQNDQTVTALLRWRVQPFTMTENPDAYTPGQKAATAKMDSYGIGAALTASNAGEFGGIGYAPATALGLGRQLPSGRGGNSTLADGSIVQGGLSVTMDASYPPQPTVPTTNVSSISPVVVHANGNNGGNPGAGAGGGIYKSGTLVMPSTFIYAVISSLSNQTADAAMAGAGSGMYGKFVWNYGDAQVGSGADYRAAAPVAGDTLYIVVGPGGIGGAGTVTGGNGGHGRVRVKWS